MNDPQTTVTDEKLARAGLTRIIEPNDQTGTALIEILGAVEAYSLVCNHTGPAPAHTQQQIADLLDANGANKATLRLNAGLERWRARANNTNPHADLQLIKNMGGGILTPTDPNWPQGFESLQLAAPIALWYRGNANTQVLHDPKTLLAIVGSRDATEYGRTITAEISAGLVTKGICIVSGGAYGIDAKAHEAALAEDPPLGTDPSRPNTIAVMAGGLDRLYPAGNEDLLFRIHRHGLLIAEVAPGTTPSRWRFLQRNRLIAALCAATIVTEARWRSGALSTAHHAAEMGRDVGATPGSIYSANSAGCHRLIREGAATLITDATEALELLGTLHDQPTPEEANPTKEPDRRDHDDLTIQDMLLLDALPTRNARTVDELASRAGLGIGSILGGLTRLTTRGLTERKDNGWIRRYPNGKQTHLGKPTPS
ncbi:DNA-protecting protein DprA [Arthrobacter sp. MYb227]|uniref:DNA-processing protein DprA n=1 Tax=Arthrobacter sp. MYb227 TaxID=1848601 RepID=UPI000CFC86B5|nr:DNA-processing protein DprA [Arthrobacter sp. MYb227]PQZ92362.1 DNA-protecting protein DprA [Arthrobacter sp. MYb227]